MTDIFDSLAITLPNGVPLGDATAADMREAVKLLRAVARLNVEMKRQYQTLVKQCGRGKLRYHVKNLEPVKRLRNADRKTKVLMKSYPH
ncbi:MAG: hypothetical protein H0W83_09860 [Planctomycetes bacterium]|nr:hypothetical protein [Planctomycetota bacterium]